MDGWSNVCKYKQMTSTDGLRDVHKYKQTTSTDRHIRKNKWTDGQTDETMTATNALGECYWPIDIGLKMRGQ